MAIAIIVHGGAWAIPDNEVAPHRHGCRTARDAGWQVLANGGSAMDAVEAAVRILEDALDLSKAEAGELELSPAPTPLRALTEDIQALWAPRASQDGVTLLVSYEGDTELAAVVDGVVA